MPGKYMNLSEGLDYVRPRAGSDELAKGQIIALLTRGEIGARAEAIEHFIAWKHTGIPGKWRAERTWHGKMLPIDRDWWTHPDLAVDWDASAANIRWNSADQPRVGHLKAFKVYCTVLLIAADVQKHWQSKINARILRVIKRRAAAKPSQPRRRGPTADKTHATLEAMRALGIDAVRAMPEKEMEAQFGVSRGTARKARDLLLSEFSETQTRTISDKL